MEPKQFADAFFGPEDERRAKCVHCGNVWYEIHFKDGLCNSCQTAKLTGKKVNGKRVKGISDLIRGAIFYEILRGIFWLVLLGSLIYLIFF